MTDPINDFFEREREAVPLLAPPVGRYDELARVARRRRGRGVAVASVAAAVVVAVAGTGAVLSTSGSGRTDRVAAPTTTPALLTTTSAAPTASTNAVAPSPTTTATLGPVPAGFEGWSVTFISDSHGWAVGGYPCSGQQCVAVIETNDGMSSWQEVAKPGTAGDLGLTGGNAVLRFADPQDGWLVGSEGVWSTHDAGRTWSPVGALTGRHIDALEAHGNFAYAVGSDGSTVWVSSDRHTDSWVAQSGLGLSGSGRDAVQIANRTVAVARSQSGRQEIRVSHDNGGHWADVSAPCTTAQFDLIDENTARYICTDGRVITQWFDHKFPNRAVGTIPTTSLTGSPVVATSVTNNSNQTVVAYTGAGVWTVGLGAQDPIIPVLKADVGYVGLTSSQGIALPATPSATYWVTINSGTSWIRRSWTS